MENCPFCGKAFKRLKSHLPHCKMADARGEPTAAEPAKKNPKTGTKKALLEEAKEQHLKNEGDDNMERTRKPQLSKKKHKHLEASSYRTQKATFEEKEKENLKEDPKNSPVDQGRTDPGSQVANIPKNILLAPGLDRPAPGLDRPAPGLDRPAPGLDRPAPGLDRPAHGLDRPAPGLDRAALGLDRPAPGLDRPAHGLGRPAPGLDTPAPGLDRPAHGLDRPAHGLGRPAPGLDTPAPGFHVHLSTSDLDQTHSDGLSDDKEGNRSSYYPIKGPTAVITLPSQEAVTSLVAVTHSQTSALQALPGGSESLKASEDNLTWPSQKEDFRGALEKTGSDGVKSPLYEEVCKVLKGGMQGENLGSFGNGLEGPFIEKHFQKPEDQPTELPSEPSSPYRLPAITSSYRLHSQFPRRTDHAPLPDKSHPRQTGDSESLKNKKKSLEGLLDLTTANKAETFLPVGDVSSRNCSLGLQWIPELHSNYIQLKIVPKKMDLTRSDGRMGKFVAPGPADSEYCQPTHRQGVPEVPLTSRQLMDVRIGELPSWLALQRLSMKSIPDLGLRAWTRYYNKYINVRKGGIGGLTMILAGYCALSYSWNYQHIRQDRWRKYH